MIKCAALFAFQSVVNVTTAAVSSFVSVANFTGGVAPSSSLLDYTIRCQQTKRRRLACSIDTETADPFFSSNVEVTFQAGGVRVLETCEVLKTRILCSPAWRGDEWTLRVYLTHVSGGAVTVFQPYGQTVMEDMHVPLFECSPQRIATPPPQLLACSSFDDVGRDRQRGAWVIRSGALQWLTRSGCLVPPGKQLPPSEAVVFMGDSHMRFFYDLYVQKMLNVSKHYQEVKHLDDSEGAVRYLARHYITRKRAPEFQKDELVETLDTAMGAEACTVFLGFGSWDLHGNGLAYTLEAMRRDLHPAVRRAEAAGHRVFLLTPPAYPSGAQHGPWAGQRNNHAHERLSREMDALFFEEQNIDISRLTRAVSETSPALFDWQCGDHLLCYRGERVVGPVGEAVLDYLLFYAFSEPAHMR
jgi:hypothetical protein